MAKLNVKGARKAPTGPITTTATRTRTHEGAPAFVRDVQSELFLLGVTNFVGEDTFYEKADARDARFASLVKQAALQYPEWTAGYLAWLRESGNMRHAPIVGAAHFVKARLEAGVPADGVSNRAVIASVLLRPDEPGDLVAYWLNTFGRAIPKPVKRGIADSLNRLYSEYGLLKYDTPSRAVRFGDVIELVHPLADTAWRGDLFKYALDRRHGHDSEIPETLRMVRAQALWRADVAHDLGSWQQLLDPGTLRAAGLTWEDVLSELGSKRDKGKLWSALIPSMGYMATLRNLRNFDEAVISPEAVKAVQARLSDVTEVRRSRQFPYRFLAAYESVNSVRWGQPLDEALTAAVANVPAELKDSLILVDTSASMTRGSFSAKSTMTPAKAAAVFGVALAMKGADLYGFADGQFRHEVRRGASLISEIAKFNARNGEVGHGTQIGAAVKTRFNPERHKRIFIISDEQTMDDATGVIGDSWGRTATVPADVAVYAFNLGGYRPTIVPSLANRITLGGLTDATFKMVPLIEAGRNAAWPWLQKM